MIPDPNILKGQYDANEIMHISWQCQMIANWIYPWVKERGGYVKVLASTKHLWEEIYVVDERPRVLICFNGEISRGDFKQANTLHRVDRNFIVAIIRGHGFKNLMSEGQGQPNTPGAIDPFYTDCETIRDKCRVLINITEEPPIDYKGMEPIPSIAPYGKPGNVFLDGYAIKFSCANDIIAITDIDPEA